MTTLLQCLVFWVSVSIWLVTPSGAFPRSGLDLRANRTRRDIQCRDGLEYPHGNICCLNCPAGTRLTSACTTAGQKGTCEECNDGTYTEHSNSLNHCFKCTQCRPDQEIVRPCTHTQDTECQCKVGRFCVPEEACEVCKKCSRCEKDEETARNCTSTANTVCKKIPVTSGSAKVVAVIVPLILVAVGALIGLCLWKGRRAAASQGNQDDEPKATHAYSGCATEESRSAERSRPSLIASRQLEDEPFPELFPVNGEESLRKCFEYFEEMNISYLKRFFRSLDLSDNVIQSQEHLQYEDRIHELLKMWVEKAGMKASLNDLLKALINLNQRLTAETIMEKAIQSGHFLRKE